MENLSKSISTVLYDRISSPLFGTFIFSWAVCNWQFFYATAFVSENRVGNKLVYASRFLTVDTILYYPLLSTVFLIVVAPVLSNAAYWMSLKFQKWKIDQKGVVLEKDRRLTYEESSQLMRDMRNQENQFTEVIRGKDEEIAKISGRLNQVTQDFHNQQSIADAFEVLYAGFGNMRTRKNVIAAVQQFPIMHPAGLVIPVDIKFLGDPAPGQKKDLIVVYRFKRTVYSATASEGQTIQIDGINSDVLNELLPVDSNLRVRPKYTVKEVG